MAIITPPKSELAVVSAPGVALSASVNLSAALMDMLSTVYKYILMAAIRESLQNACDAARRAGMSFADGVLVTLPTRDNPVFMVADQGAGMTKEFMEGPYLSFGTSTKAGDNGAAGGLGVGRWAAYGYIGEAYIVTCNAEDMIERTYFQFRGESGIPSAQLANEVPGKATGTRIFFPVKEQDIDEVLHAVAWLQSCMSLTLGDKFSVDAPARLPNRDFGVPLMTVDLGDRAADLVGCRVHVMASPQLQYLRDGLGEGSLVVMTNREAGIGGLPFHVDEISGIESVFNKACVIEIPMRLNVSFMPSREELKYTDEVKSLLLKIDRVAGAMVADRVGELRASTSLKDKRLLSKLLLDSNNPFGQAHNCSKPSGHGADPDLPLGALLREKSGGWGGRMRIPVTPAGRDCGGRWITSKSDIMGLVHHGFSNWQRHFAGGLIDDITFEALLSLKVVINDLPAGGVGRFRKFLRDAAETGNRGCNYYFLLTGPKKTLEAAQAELNEAFGGELTVIRTSSLPEAPRVIVGDKIKERRKVNAGSLTAYDFRNKKQEIFTGSFAGQTGSRHAWIERSEAGLHGLKKGTTPQQLCGEWSTSIIPPLRSLGIERLFLLTPKQARTLREQQAAVATALEEDGSDESINEADFRNRWTPLEEAMAEVAESPTFQQILAGNITAEVIPSHELTRFVQNVTAVPRMGLAKSRFDRWIAPYADVLNGTDKLLIRDTVAKNGYKPQCIGLALYGSLMEPAETDTAHRKALHELLMRFNTVGVVNYMTVWQDCIKRFPLVAAVNHHGITANADVMSHFVLALATIYK